MIKIGDTIKTYGGNKELNLQVPTEFEVPQLHDKNGVLTEDGEKVVNLAITQMINHKYGGPKRDWREGDAPLVLELSAIGVRSGGPTPDDYGAADLAIEYGADPKLRETIAMENRAKRLARKKN